MEAVFGEAWAHGRAAAGEGVFLVTWHAGHLDVHACCLLAVDVGLGSGLSQVRAVIVEIKFSLPLCGISHRCWVKTCS